MQSLPYEILQLVATWLLPRSQCRLALASKWCYRHLYTDLLRWHAAKYSILVPKHKIYCEDNTTISVLVILSHKPRVLMLEFNLRRLYIKSLIDRYLSIIGVPDGEFGYECYNARVSHNADLWYQFKIYRKFDILAGYYQYIPKKVLLLYVNIRQPIYSLDRELIKYIYRKLHKKDTHNLSEAYYII